MTALATQAGRLAQRAVPALIVTTVLGVFTAMVYAAVVVGVGALLGRHSHLPLMIVATVLVGTGFNATRSRVRRWAGRLLRQPVADPDRMFRHIADAGAGANDEVLQEVIQAVAAATGAAEVRVRLGEDGTPPPDGDRDRVIPVRHQGELLGAFVLIGVAPGTSEQDLLSDLAAHAGLVLRNARLTAQLRSRRDELTTLAAELARARLAIVNASDRERQRLANDLDELAAPHLEAVESGLRSGPPPAVAASLPELRAHVDKALAEVRRISHGLRP
jgi:signal transduction histidine kinase